MYVWKPLKNRKIISTEAAEYNKLMNYLSDMFFLFKQAQIVTISLYHKVY